MTPPDTPRLTELEVEAVARAIELGEVTPRTRQGPPYPKGWEVLSVYDEERARAWQLSQERARAERAERILREAAKLAQWVVDDNDVSEMYGAGQRRAAERILSVLRHADTTGNDDA